MSSLRAANNRGKSCSRLERTFTGHILGERSVAGLCFISSLTSEKSGSALEPSALSQFISGYPLFTFVSEIVAGPLNSEYSVSVSLVLTKFICKMEMETPFHCLTINVSGSALIGLELAFLQV